jgi:DNA-binding NtrC family response regulator
MGRSASNGIEGVSTTAPHGGGKARATGAFSFLIRIGQSHRPYGIRPLLLDVSRIPKATFGRGQEDSVLVLANGSLQVDVRDPWMSSQHGEILQSRVANDCHFILQDLGSRNGCMVDGHPVTGSHSLTHGDIIEMGCTFWKFVQGVLPDYDAVCRAIYSGATPIPTFCLRFASELSRLTLIAQSNVPVILSGESGAGKEVLSREIHQRSGRTGRFVALNCAALPEGLIESELFGHRKGAFTGAIADKTGVVEEADNGTLLLDEIGDMPLGAQAKLLRLLQEGNFTRVGDTRAREVDVRFLAATHRQLPEMVEQERFRGDLYARLNGYHMTIPPLRERSEDLGLLIGHCVLNHGPEIAISNASYRALLHYDWPYNVRELDKVIAAALALAREGDQVQLEHLPTTIAAHAHEANNAEPRQRSARPSTFETIPFSAQGLIPTDTEERKNYRPRLSDEELRASLLGPLQRHGGNVSAIARELNTTRTQIHRWLRRLEIDPESFRS